MDDAKRVDLDTDEDQSFAPYNSVYTRSSRIPFIVTALFIISIFLAAVISMSVGWVKKIEAQNELSGGLKTYKALFFYYTDTTCELATESAALGPCWKGIGPGYDGYYWKFTCDENYLIFEALCTDGVNCSACRAGRHWGEAANQCLMFNDEYYRWICAIS